MTNVCSEERAGKWNTDFLSYLARRLFKDFSFVGPLDREADKSNLVL